MDTILPTFLEILKYTIPALIVFATIYFLIKKFFESQLALESLKIRDKNSNIAIPVRLKAYERLVIMCERMSAEDLSMRLRSSNMTVGQLQNAMMIALKQEFDHNLSQQTYVSAKLWEIISLAKDQELNLIARLSDDLSQQENGELLSDKLIELRKQSGRPLHTAIRAIKQEVALMF